MTAAPSPTPPGREGAWRAAGQVGRRCPGVEAPDASGAHVRGSARTLGEPGSPSLLARVALGGSVRWPGCRGLFCSRRAPTPPRRASCGQRRATAAAQAQRMAAAQRCAQGRPGALMGAAQPQSPGAEARARGAPGRLRGMSVRGEPGAAARRAPGRRGRGGCGALLSRAPSLPRAVPSRPDEPSLRPKARAPRGRAHREDPSAGSRAGAWTGRAAPLTTRWGCASPGPPTCFGTAPTPSQEADSPWEPLTRIGPAPDPARLPHLTPAPAGWWPGAPREETGYSGTHSAISPFRRPTSLRISWVLLAPLGPPAPGSWWCLKAWLLTLLLGKAGPGKEGSWPTALPASCWP